MYNNYYNLLGIEKSEKWMRLFIIFLPKCTVDLLVQVMVSICLQLFCNPHKLNLSWNICFLPIEGTPLHASLCLIQLNCNIFLITYILFSFFSFCGFLGKWHIKKDRQNRRVVDNNEGKFRPQLILSPSILIIL